MRRLLFVYQDMRPFIQHDIDILSEEYELEMYHYPMTGGLRDVIKRGRAIKKPMRSVDGVFVWFGDVNAAFAVRASRKYDKPSAIIAGGYDGAYLPGTKYGLQQRPIRKRVIRYAFQKCDLVLTVSDYLHKDLLRFAKPRKAVRIYNGIPVENYEPKGKKDRKALTVAFIDETSIWRKGIKDFVEAATHLPDVPFVLVGSAKGDLADKLKEKAPDNVEFTGYIKFDELLELMQSSKVYVQGSAYESFGYSVAEAMLCHSVPVVCRRGALPEVIGDTGVFIEFANPRDMARGIGEALEMDTGPSARKHVIDNFSLEKRKDLILGELSKIF